ncbi:MAG: hypothetical protein V3U65_10565 [Granulosicoccaceae bacterium]
MVQTQFDKNMGITHSDFFRLLPKAMGDHPYTINGNTVNADVEGGKLMIGLGEQQERRIALMRIPFVIVNFDFSSVGDEGIEAFVQHFDLHFQRGGG